MQLVCLSFYAAINCFNLAICSQIQHSVRENSWNILQRTNSSFKVLPLQKRIITCWIPKRQRWISGHNFNFWRVNILCVVSLMDPRFTVRIKKPWTLWRDQTTRRIVGRKFKFTLCYKINTGAKNTTFWQKKIQA